MQSCAGDALVEFVIQADAEDILEKLRCGRPADVTRLVCVLELDVKIFSLDSPVRKEPGLQADARRPTRLGRSEIHSATACRFQSAPDVYVAVRDPAGDVRHEIIKRIR